jgi:hypothetical protein
MYAAEKPKTQTALKREDNPFASGEGGLRSGRALQTALGEVIGHIAAEAPFVVVEGSAGAGKSLLLDMTFRACSTMGLPVRHADRAELLQLCLRERSDVLLIDHAEIIPVSTLEQLFAPDQKNAATTTILFWRSDFAFAGLNLQAVVVHLQALSDSDSRAYLMERAASIGRPDLFGPDAVDLIIRSSHGSLQHARTLAKFAFFAAAMDGAPQIELAHVADVLTMQSLPDVDKHLPAPAPAIPRGEPKPELVLQAQPRLDDLSTPEVVAQNPPASDQPPKAKWTLPRLPSYRPLLNAGTVQRLSALDHSLYERIDVVLPRALIGAGAFLALTAFAGLVFQVKSDHPAQLYPGSFAVGSVQLPQDALPSSTESDVAETAKQISDIAPEDSASADAQRAPIVPSAKPAIAGKTADQKRDLLRGARDENSRRN